MLKVGKQSKDLGFKSRDQLKQLLLQIHLMKSYATEQGMQVPPAAAESIATLGSLTEGGEQSVENAEVADLDDDLRRMHATEIMAALKKAFEVHGNLADLVKPVTPESIEASQPREGWTRITSPRISDLLAALTIIGIVTFLVGTILARNPETVRAGVVQVSYLGAALLGASFSGLYTAFKYVSTRTLDPLRTSGYLNKVMLGTVSGLILANFGESFLTGKSSDLTVQILAPAALALVGGYSADAVNLILHRVSETLVAAVRGSGDDAINAKQAQLEAESKAGEVQQRQATAVELGELLAIAPDDKTRAAIQRLMAAVGKGEDVSGTVTDKSSGQVQGEQGTK